MSPRQGRDRHPGFALMAHPEGLPQYLREGSAKIPLASERTCEAAAGASFFLDSLPPPAPFAALALRHQTQGNGSAANRVSLDLTPVRSVRPEQRLAAAAKRFHRWSNSGPANSAPVNGPPKQARARRWRHAPAHQRHLAIGADVPHHRRRVVGKNTRHRRQVADVAVDHAEQREDRFLVCGDRMEMAHNSSVTADPSEWPRPSRRGSTSDPALRLAHLFLAPGPQCIRPPRASFL